MNTLALLGLMVAAAADGGSAARAVLVTQHVNRAFAGEQLLICEYSGAGARFEILSQSGQCAPYLTVR